MKVLNFECPAGNLVGSFFRICSMTFRLRFGWVWVDFPRRRGGKPRKNHTYGGLLMSRQGRRKKQKKPHFVKRGFRGLPIWALMSPLWEARKEEKTKKTKKPHFVKRVFFKVCPYGLLCHLCGRQGRRKNEKTTLCKTWVYRGLPIRALMSPLRAL